MEVIKPMTVKTEKIDMNSRIGERFEPVSITPRRMVEVLDCDDEKIKGLSIGQTTYKLSDRFYKTLAAELGIPFGVFGFFTPLEVMTRAAEKEPDLALRVTVDTERNQALGLTQDKGLPMPVKFIEGVLHEDRRLQEVEYGNGMLSAMLDLDDPSKVVGISREPLLVPEATCEKDGFRGSVIFPGGMILEDDGEVKIYYGAADTVECLATADLSDLLSLVEPM